MSTMFSQITGVSIVYSTVGSGADQIKHQSFASQAFVRGIHRWRVNSPHKGTETRNKFPHVAHTHACVNESMHYACSRFHSNNNFLKRRHHDLCERFHDSVYDIYIYILCNWYSTYTIKICICFEQWIMVCCIITLNLGPQINVCTMIVVTDTVKSL